MNQKKFLPIFFAVSLEIKKKATASLLVACIVLFLTPFVYAEHAVNINTADSAALQTLNGIGPSKAQAIIDYRTQNGPFATVEDVKNVSGIGETTFNNIKDHITVSDGVSTQNTEGGLQTETQTSQTQTQAASAPVSSYVAPPTPDFYAHAGADRVVIVGADTEFVGRAYNNKGEAIEHARFMWNFGDGGVAEGERVLHHWDYPGRYATTLDIAGGRNAASHRIVVTAEAAKLSVSIGGDGAIVVKNDSGRDLDLSRWLLAAGGKTFVLQQNTILLRGAEVAFPTKTTELNQLLDGTVGLQYPNGIFAVKVREKNAEAAQALPAPQVRVPTSQTPVASSIDALTPELEEETEIKSETQSIATSTQLAATGSANSRSRYFWWLGAGLTSLLGAGAVYALRRRRVGEWKIIDES